MKKFLVLATAIAAFCACNTKDDINNVTNEPGVSISFTDELSTRAFFDDTATPEPWESTLHSLFIYCYDQSGTIILRRTLTADELTARRATFALPNSSTGTQVQFYVVANAPDMGMVPTVAQMDGLASPDGCEAYNGTFAAINTGSLRSDGFVMTGKTTATVAPQGSTTNIAVTLKRLVAKVAVRTTVSDNLLANINGGSVILTSAKLENVTKASYLYTPSPMPTSYALRKLQQTVGGTNSFDNLFYVCENGTRADEGKVKLTLTGYYQSAGGDRSDLEYTVMLNGHGNGEIKRNAYYRLDLTVNGLAGADVIVTLTVADWDAPVTETIDLGL